MSQSGHESFGLVVVVLDQRLPRDVVLTLRKVTTKVNSAPSSELGWWEGAVWHLHSWRVEAHVIDSPAGGVDPAVAQSLRQRGIRHVEDDDQVELHQTV